MHPVLHGLRRNPKHFRRSGLHLILMAKPEYERPYLVLLLCTVRQQDEHRIAKSHRPVIISE